MGRGELHEEWTGAWVSASRATMHRLTRTWDTSLHSSCQATPEPETTSEASYLAYGEKELVSCSVVLISDESPFCDEFGNKGLRVWRKSGEAPNQRCLKSSVKFPQSGMIWGAMSSAGVGPLCFIKSKVNAAVNQDILEHFMLPFSEKLNADFIFQQDLAPAHTANMTKPWLNDHGDIVLHWPAKLA